MEDSPRLYGDLAPWFPLVTAPADYAEEAGIFHAALRDVARRPLRWVLELGSGGGNNASHLKQHFEMVLVDLSPAILEVSRVLNPECRHETGDMRTVRLGEEFDAVFLHDALSYLLTGEDLRAAAATAFVHTAPGGAALFVPDWTRETFRPGTSHGGHDGPQKSLRYLQWLHDPDPDDTEVIADFVFLLREDPAEVPRVISDRHRMGVFSRRVWLDAIEDAGFVASARPYEHSEFEPDAGLELLLGVRPG